MPSWRKWTDIAGGISVQVAQRYWDRKGATNSDYGTYPPLLANAFPNSGARVLQCILGAFPGTRYYGTCITSIRPTPPRRLSDKNHISLIKKIAPGEIVRAHMEYKKDRHSALIEMGACHFFIYRDLRDLIVCELEELLNFPRTHRLHSLLSALPPEDRVRTCIQGADDPFVRLPFHSIDKRFAAYNGWIDKPEVCAIKYEELAGAQQATTISRMINYFASRTDVPVDKAQLQENAQAALRNAASPIECGSWQDVFTPTLQRIFEDHAGALNQSLGYD